jgi:hypothetical protein
MSHGPSLLFIGVSLRVLRINESNNISQPHTEGADYTYNAELNPPEPEPCGE